MIQYQGKIIASVFLLATFFMLMNLPPFLLVKLTPKDVVGKWVMVSTMQTKHTSSLKDSEFLILRNYGVVEFCNIHPKTYSLQSGLDIQSGGEWVINHQGVGFCWNIVKVLLPESQRPLAGISFVAYCSGGKPALYLLQPDNYKSIPYNLVKLDDYPNGYVKHIVISIIFTTFLVTLSAYISWKYVLKKYFTKKITFSSQGLFKHSVDILFTLLLVANITLIGIILF